jgi:CHAT domain-containing protein
LAKNLENICWVGITQLAYGDRSRNRTHDYRQTQVQFDFRDRLEPVYREFTDLLLTTKDNTQPSQENLGRAIKAIDALQIAELENYLGCNLSELIELDETTFDPTAVRIYPIILSERLVTIVDTTWKVSK